ncbi:MAG: hypothetical protein ACYTFV_18105 [Planctomycetota bacterium]|jgi:hypothetical protein
MNREPGRSVVDPVALLHRHDSFIATGFKESDGRWTEGPAIRGGQLGFDFDSVFGSDRPDRFDQYLSLNGLAGVQRPYGPAQRSNDNVVRLCAAAVDIDAHAISEERGFYVGSAQAAGGALDRARARKLPEPSMVVESGRGAWLLWLLADEAGNAITCTHEARLKYRATVKTLATSLQDIGADMACLDEARMLRAPGSRNRKAYESPEYADDEVRWLPVFGRRSTPVWTLDELATEAKVEIGAIEAERERIELKAAGINPDRKPKKPLEERDQVATSKAVRRWTLLAERIETLGALRGGFAKGTRSMAVKALTTGLYRSKHDEAETLERARRIGRACSPPLPDGEIREAVNSARSIGTAGVTNQHWADELRITPEEADALTVNHSTTGRPFPAASEYRTAPTNAKLSRPEQRRIRIEWLQARFPGGVCREPLVELCEACRDETGLAASEKTIAADLDLAGIVRAKHGSRPSLLPFDGA